MRFNHSIGMMAKHTSSPNNIQLLRNWLCFVFSSLIMFTFYLRLCLLLWWEPNKLKIKYPQTCLVGLFESKLFWWTRWDSMLNFYQNWNSIMNVGVLEIDDGGISGGMGGGATSSTILCLLLFATKATRNTLWIYQVYDINCRVHRGRALQSYLDEILVDPSIFPTELITWQSSRGW